MDLFGRKTKQLKLEVLQIEENIKTSFEKVRQDTETTNAWLSYYYGKSQYLESQLNQIFVKTNNINSRISDTNSSLKKHSSMISDLTDNSEFIVGEISELKANTSRTLTEDRLNFYIEKIYNEILKVDRKVEDLSFVPSKVESLKEQLSLHMAEPHSTEIIDKKIDEIQEKLKQLIIKKSPKAKLIQKITKNSHDYIRAMVISYIKKYEKISAFQLRDMVVEEQNLTSKSTFYRILEEIEQLDEISVVRQGKEKLYLSRLKKHA